MALSKELKKSLNQLDFPSSQYYREGYHKKQIVLHHTASGRGAKGDYRHFLTTPERVATFCIIDDNNIQQLFSSKYWGHHLGIKSKVFKEKKLPSINRYLNKISIGIEIDAWGPLRKEGNSYYSYLNTKVSSKEVCKLKEPYKGYKYYHCYSDKQLYFLSLLLPYLSKTYNTDISYKEDIWEVTDRALKGEEGLFTHNSYRVDKTDVFPQPELISLLKSF